MTLDTLTCGAVAQAAWHVSENRDKWPLLRQSYERDLKRAAKIFTTLASDSNNADHAELREALKELHPEVLRQVVDSLTAMANGQLVDNDIAEFIYAMFSILDPRPPTVSPVLQGSHRDS